MSLHDKYMPIDSVLSILCTNLFIYAHTHITHIIIYNVIIDMK